MKFPLWGRRRREAELEEEIQSHLQMAMPGRIGVFAALALVGARRM